MDTKETAKAATAAETIGDLRNFDHKLAGQIDFQNTGSEPQTQGLPLPNPNFFDAQERVIAEIATGRRKCVRVTASTRGGRPVIDLRVHEPDGRRGLQSARAGIGGIDPDVARAIAAALLQFAEGSV